MTPSSICSGMPPTSPADDRPRLPDRLRDGQPEALARRFLDHHVGVRLERVDLDRADVVEVAEDVDVGVVVGMRERGVEEVPPFRIVARHRPDERELDVAVGRLHDPVAVDHAERVLPRVEARDLAHERPRGVDAQLVADVGRFVGGERHVLGREWIDRGRDDVHVAVHARGNERLQMKDALRVVLHLRQELLERSRVRRREIEVAAPDPPARLLRGEHVEGGGLGVVHEADVPTRGKLARVHLVVAPPRVPLFARAQVRVRALERVVQELGRVRRTPRARRSPATRTRGRRRA